MPDMNYSIWAKFRNEIECLEGFNENIDSNLHPIISFGYKKEISNSIKIILNQFKNFDLKDKEEK